MSDGSSNSRSAFRGTEGDIVIGVGVERRIEVDQVHALVAHVFAQHVEVVAVVEGIGHGAIMNQPRRFPKSPVPRAHCVSRPVTPSMSDR